MPAFARTWRVEKDGSGDFTTIQPSLDASSPGDTIMIGPGRFTETHEVSIPDWTNDVYAAVWNDSISIIGAGADVTIIGPEAASKQPNRPIGIFGAYHTAGNRVHELTIENISDGMLWGGGVEIHDCIIRGVAYAMLLFPFGNEVVVAQTLIENSMRIGIYATGACSWIDIASCEIDRGNTGVSIVGLDGVVIDNCTFNRQVVSVQYESSQGSIRSCEFRNGNHADIVSYGSDLSVFNCRLSSAYRAIIANTLGAFSGSGNIIPPGRAERIEIVDTQFDFQGNHILRGSGPYIKLGGFSTMPIHTLVFLEITGARLSQIRYLNGYGMETIIQGYSAS